MPERRVDDPDDPAIAEQLARVADLIEDGADDFIDRLMTRRTAFPIYEVVSDDDLRASGRRNVSRVIATLRGQDRLPVSAVNADRETGRQRARQGITAETMTSLFRSVFVGLRDGFVDAAGDAGCESEAILAGTHRLWRLADEMTSSLLAGYHEAELERARSDESRRASFLNALMSGTVGGDDHHPLPYGMRRSVQYWVVRAVVEPDRHEELQAALRSQCGIPGFPALLARTGDDLVGVVACPPSPHPAIDEAIVAIDGPAEPDGLHACSATASVLLVAARYLGRRGIIERSTLGVYLAVLDRIDIGGLLSDQYLQPLMSKPSGREVIATIRAYLEHRRSVAATARALTVHENTVRYRLDQFTRLTGADLTDTECLVETWWAITHDGLAEPRSETN
jgi:PucR C-terminal helix-turn-helix domain